MKEQTQAWYNSGLINQIGRGICYSMVVGVIGVSIIGYRHISSSYTSDETMRFVAQQECLVKRMETLDNLLGEYGHEMTPSEFERFSRSVLGDACLHPLNEAKR